MVLNFKVKSSLRDQSPDISAEDASLIDDSSHLIQLQRGSLINTFTTPENYEAYVKITDEKIILHQELTRAFFSGELPIKPGESNKKVLDLGCGLGTNTLLLLSLFKEHDVYAIDRSKDFLSYIQLNLLAPNNNLFKQHIAFEDFSKRNFDLILCSHVLQYIDTPLRSFLKKIIESLAPGGEAWIVLQEEQGINQLVRASLPFLNNPSPYFSRWFVHDHVRKMLIDLNVKIETWKFPTYFRTPNIKEITKVDTSVLNFILLNDFDPTNNELVSSIAAELDSVSRSGAILHEVGITRIRRLS